MQEHEHQETGIIGGHFKNCLKQGSQVLVVLSRCLCPFGKDEHINMLGVARQSLELDSDIFDVCLHGFLAPSNELLNLSEPYHLYRCEILPISIE